MPDSTFKTRDKKGRWQPGVSGNPQGRPITNPARQMLMEKAEDLMKKAISMALEGDTAALNTCISRIIPQYRPVQAPVSLEIDLDDDLTAIGRQVVAAAADGQCPPDVAANLLQGLGTLARITEIQELRERLEALERTLKKRKT
jgi:hypothetical protein